MRQGHLLLAEPAALCCLRLQSRPLSGKHKLFRVVLFRVVLFRASGRQYGHLAAQAAPSASGRGLKRCVEDHVGVGDQSL